MIRKFLKSIIQTVNRSAIQYINKGIQYRGVAYFHRTPPSKTAQSLVAIREEFGSNNWLDGVDAFKHAVTALDNGMELLGELIAHNVRLSTSVHWNTLNQQLFEFILFRKQTHRIVSKRCEGVIQYSYTECEIFVQRYGKQGCLFRIADINKFDLKYHICPPWNY